MNEIISENWIILLLSWILGLVGGGLIFRPSFQRVSTREKKYQEIQAKIDEVLATAWDEGYQFLAEQGGGIHDGETFNPYRRKSE